MFTVSMNLFEVFDVLYKPETPIESMYYNKLLAEKQWWCGKSIFNRTSPILTGLYSQYYDLAKKQRNGIFRKLIIAFFGGMRKGYFTTVVDWHSSGGLSPDQLCPLPDLLSLAIISSDVSLCV